MELRSLSCQREANYGFMSQRYFDRTGRRVRKKYNLLDHEPGYLLKKELSGSSQCLENKSIYESRHVWTFCLLVQEEKEVCWVMDAVLHKNELHGSLSRQGEISIYESNIRGTLCTHWIETEVYAIVMP